MGSRQRAGSANGSSAPPDNPQFLDLLNDIGLRHLHSKLLAHGFDSWDTLRLGTGEDWELIDIALQDKLTLRSRLSSEEQVVKRSSTSPGTLSVEGSNGIEYDEQHASFQEDNPQKRRYRRKPKPDANAPERPPTAYVMFSNSVREDPTIAAMSFVDIARLVGERWQALPPAVKEAWEKRAADQHRRYRDVMTNYKQTPSYKQHQDYLMNFKDKQSKVQVFKSSQPRVREVAISRDELKTTETMSEVETLRARVKELERMLQASSRLPGEQGHAKQTSSLSFKSESTRPPNRSSSGLLVSRTNGSDPTPELTPDMAESDRTPTPQDKSGQGHSPLPDSRSDVHSYDRQSLPPQDLTQKAVEFFFEGSGLLFYFMTRSEAEGLYNQVFHPEQEPSLGALSQICAMAAMGCYYDSDESNTFPGNMREAFHRTSIIHLSSTIELGDLSSLRLTGVIALYLIMTNHASARAIVSLGLQMSRWGNKAYRSQPGWKKVLRTLLSIEWYVKVRSLGDVKLTQESWLSASLGYASDITPEESEIAVSACSEDSPTVRNAMQDRLAAIFILTANIMKDLCKENFLSLERIEIHEKALQDWHLSLPDYMQLSSLASDETLHLELDTRKKRRRVMLVHMMYLGANILLHRRTLVAKAESRLYNTCVASHTFGYSEKYSVQCICAAQGIARVADILAFDGAISKRCWLAIHECFSATTVLLYQTSQSIMHLLRNPNTTLPAPSSSIEEDLEYCRKTMAMLHYSASVDPVAATNERQLRPLYDALCDIAATLAEVNPRRGGGISPIYPRLQHHNQTQSKTTYTKVVEVMKQITDLLRHPFSDKPRGPEPSPEQCHRHPADAWLADAKSTTFGPWKGSQQRKGEPASGLGYSGSSTPST